MKAVTGILLCVAGLLAIAPAQAEPVLAPHIEVELVAQRSALQTGTSTLVGVRLNPDEHWHTYWRNPGDAGLATRIEWNLPDGVAPSDILWPAPSRFSLGDIVNYGYEAETLLPVRIHVDADWPAPQALKLSATVHWLVCADVCIPGSAELSLTLPTQHGSAPLDEHWAPMFADTLQRIPSGPPIKGRYQAGETQVRFELPLGGTPESSGEPGYFYPYANDLINHSATQRHELQGDMLQLAQARSDYFQPPSDSIEGVVVFADDTRRARTVTLLHGELAALAESEPAPAVAVNPQPADSLLAVLFAALLGGLILNLMPCVLPVLAIKALSLVEQRGAELGAQRLHALVYTVGVIASCLAIAVALLAARTAGELAGWGFHLQSPIVVGFLAYVMVAIGLSLAGVMSVGDRLMGVGQSLTDSKGYSGSFFTGVLAVVVASPCTAPFMGAAMGYAMTQPAEISLLVFACLGLGLALPFLLIAFVPPLGRLLPRPGAWMEGFKQLMAFPMFLTAVWLIWVLTRQTGADGGAILLAGTVLLAMSAWLWGRTQHGARGLRGLLAFALLAAALSLLRLPERLPSAAASATVAEQDLSTPYSAEHLESLVSRGETVLLNLTADWCLTCIANERVALSSQRVRARLAEPGIHYLKGDWTNGDPAITAVLERFGRNGVPLYAVWRQGHEAVLLPQLLTADIVIDALGPPASAP